jgi:hypothetical protein
MDEQAHSPHRRYGLHVWLPILPHYHPVASPFTPFFTDKGILTKDIRNGKEEFALCRAETFWIPPDYIDCLACIFRLRIQ